ncbi:hypothetical protein PoB_001633400 [Plakobranchus ocellatus]|uniref:Macro domain-containing protein n=1 Tax=Plakobranchus ocellatus TaxID=259542 RepID=A0AAV3Z753_9GAST|nr:hypothetical protein PoB_001633400 [Plakobranchus ocellatus]
MQRKPQIHICKNPRTPVNPKKPKIWGENPSFGSPDKMNGVCGLKGCVSQIGPKYTGRSSADVQLHSCQYVCGRICGPVGDWTCSYECELMAVTECLRVVIEKQGKGAALPGVVIFTHCRALVQALGGSVSEGVGEAVLLGDYLLKTEGVRTVVQ